MRQTMKGTFSNTANATWLSGQTNITLFATSVGENDATLNINYQVRPPRRLMTHNLPSNSEVETKFPNVAEIPLTNVFQIEASQASATTVSIRRLTSGFF